MLGIISNRISLKVSLVVNCLLAAVMVAGTIYLSVQNNKNLERQFYESVKLKSILGAKGIGRIIEEAVDNGVLSLEDALDTNYILIEGFDPPKYHTKYDFYADKSFAELQDEFLKDPRMVYAAAVDINGYLPTHNFKFQQKLTNDFEKDKSGNRTKRIFNDEVGKNAARNREEGFRQTYYRDTGEVLWDISSPIFVKKKHWGAFRIGYSVDILKESKSQLAKSLIIVMFIIWLFSAISICIVVHVALKPLNQITQLASELASGNLSSSIKFSSKDEIGQLAEILERLRISMQTAIKRLQKRRIII